jgi:hypothetical protein
MARVQFKNNAMGLKMPSEYYRTGILMRRQGTITTGTGITIRPLDGTCA